MQSDTQDASGIQELYRSEYIVVRQVAMGDRENWVITFDNYGIGQGFDRPGFGQDWLRAQQISAIHVLGRSEDWYQYDDIADALATVRAVVQDAPRVMTYGSSMGGYAAIRFADAVGAKSALALSPQYTLDPAIAGHDLRWAQDARRIRWIKALNGPLKTRARVVTVYDPSGLDGWHGKWIEKAPAVTSIRLPFTAHPVTSYLSEIGVLGDLVVRVLHDKFDPVVFRRDARLPRRFSSVYLGELAGAQPAHRRQTALSLARLAVAVNPINHHGRVNLARLLLLDGHTDEALSLFAGLVADSDRALTYLVDQGQAMARAGRLSDAHGVAKEVVARAGNVAHLHAWAAHIYWLSGDTRGARNVIRQAVRLDPGNTGYLRWAIDFHFGRPAHDANSPVKSTVSLRIARWAGRRSAIKIAATRAWSRRSQSGRATRS